MPETNERQSSLLRSVNRIDDLLDDIEHGIALSRPSSVLCARKSSLCVPRDRRRQRHRQPHRRPPIQSLSRKEKESILDVRSRRRRVFEVSRESTITSRSDRPIHRQANSGWDSSFCSLRPRGDKVAIYNTLDGTNQSLRLSDAPDTKQSVIPNFGPNLTALTITGPKVTRIAVASTRDGWWYPQDLREPAQSGSDHQHRDRLLHNGPLYLCLQRRPQSPDGTFWSFRSEPILQLLSTPMVRCVLATAATFSCSMQRQVSGPTSTRTPS